MADRPTLFSGSMVRAILAGTKTQTRRVLTDVPAVERPGDYLDSYCGGERTAENPRGMTHTWNRWTADHRCGPSFKVSYVPGDRLWVREAWAPNEAPGRDAETIYRADIHDQVAGYSSSDGISVSRWRPSIHMPRSRSRITLRVTDVRVERLQGISNEDAIAEGVEPLGEFPAGTMRYRDYSGTLSGTGNARRSFSTLWDSINGKKPGRTWADNPWVAAISFERESGDGRRKP
ncbi:MAG: hypothetical protein AAF311_16405 [Pseudomonadota bacterium]